ncbi:MAG: 2-hydroxyacid dehydrogenase [Planctomycetia bacterium]|nr:MAG: 2-hydroxyacid dehydrogenase [Planctomycetia bacterium]
MKIVFFSTRAFERTSFPAANAAHGHSLEFLSEGLSPATAILARGAGCACLSVGDHAGQDGLAALREVGVRLIALRSAGFNHVDLDAAERLGLTVARVPAYSPHSVAEHALALLMTLNRKIHRAYNRIREQNFSLEGLMGFDLHGKTVGVVGTGQIGEAFIRIMLGMGCRVLASDPYQNPRCVELGVRYVPTAGLWPACDVISLNCPLTPQTRHLVSDAALATIKPGAVLINTSRGAVVDTVAVIAALKSGRLGGLAIDVYEEEGDLFYRDLSGEILQDDVFVRLMTFPNVLITGHQGFFTREAVAAIAETTLDNATRFERGTIPSENLVSISHVVSSSSNA